MIVIHGVKCAEDRGKHALGREISVLIEDNNHFL